MLCDPADGVALLLVGRVRVLERFAVLLLSVDVDDDVIGTRVVFFGVAALDGERLM